VIGCCVVALLWHRYGIGSCLIAWLWHRYGIGSCLIAWLWHRYGIGSCLIARLWHRYGIGSCLIARLRHRYWIGCCLIARLMRMRRRVLQRRTAAEPATGLLVNASQLGQFEGGCVHGSSQHMQLFVDQELRVTKPLALALRVLMWA
jgi:hypothetical protein